MNIDLDKHTVILTKLRRNQDKNFNEILAKYGLSVFYIQYLLLFNQEDKQFTLKEITELLDTNKSTTTRAVKVMLLKGLLKKVKLDNNKHRGYNIELTEKGKEVTSKISNDITEYNMKMLSVLDTLEEQEQLLKLLDKFLTKLDETNYL